MPTTRYIPIKGVKTKTYIYSTDLEIEIDIRIKQEAEDRWSGWVEELPGCATWGYTEGEALEATKEAAQAYIEVLIKNRRNAPAKSPVEASHMIPTLHV